ncbi:10531_t:CDS:2 [Cetraspora pellucida]|uniref:10531_t:CDS:1 n=1 Tax=Cetraspora pellucida TaxID=1433469 RepID=A0A9N9F1W0_9GLOM|nr:10531_t:CDS:2 [Cetraspora pellucida]
MNIDELPTKVQDESTVIEQLEKFIQTNTLDEKEKKKALEFFRKEKLLFTKDIQELKTHNVNGTSTEDKQNKDSCSITKDKLALENKHK